MAKKITINYDSHKEHWDVDVDLILDTRYALKDGRYRVNIRLGYNKKYMYQPTGLKLKSWSDITPEDLEKVQKRHTEAFELVKDLYSRDIFSFDEFKARVDAPKVTSIQTLMEEKIKELKAHDQFSTAGHYSSALEMFKKACGEETTFSQLSVTQIKKFVDYMDKTGKSESTKCIYLSDVKTVINTAYYNGLIKDCNYPFKRNPNEKSKIEMPRPEKRKKWVLTKEEMMQIFDYYDKTKDKYIAIFLCSYLAGGMNLADLLRLKYDQHYFDSKCKEFAYRRKKTEKKSSDDIRVAISSKLRSLLPERSIELNSYVYPYLDGKKTELEKKKAIFNVQTRVIVHLKKMCKELDFYKNVTPTYARHSFSTILRKEKVNPEFIEYSLGHKEYIKGSGDHYFEGWSTEELLKFSENLLDEAHAA